MFTHPATINSSDRNPGTAFSRKSASAPSAADPAKRTHILMSFGLTERDLDFMGPAQRAMVEDVVDRVLGAHSLE
ncbi:MAG: hypothetical protein WD075_06045 [Rhodospirillales bacterium]